MVRVQEVPHQPNPQPTPPTIGTLAGGQGRMLAIYQCSFEFIYGSHRNHIFLVMVVLDEGSANSPFTSKNPCTQGTLLVGREGFEPSKA